MIRIQRPAVAPAGLGPGAALVAAKSALHDADPALYATHKGRFDFDEDVYGCVAVREILRTAQHRKCCFCESRVEHVGSGEIEHFRPKAAWRQAPGSKLTRPGYYWLAYEWENLLWSCKTCNGRHKKNTFPLVDPSVRDCVGRSTVAEAPLLVDPVALEPRDHIRFEVERAFALSPLGQSTIDVLQLNREQLLEERRERVNAIILAQESIEKSARLGEPPSDRATTTLATATLPASPYSSMAIDLLADLAATAPADA